jgi:hypothetical protein
MTDRTRITLDRTICDRVGIRAKHAPPRLKADENEAVWGSTR